MITPRTAPVERAWGARRASYAVALALVGTLGFLTFQQVGSHARVRADNEPTEGREKTSFATWAWTGLSTGWRYTSLTSRTAVDLVIDPSFNLERVWNDYGNATAETQNLAKSVAVHGLIDFHVCGNFCGPGWCNNYWQSEWDSAEFPCGPSYMEPQQDPITGQPSCADSCCREHDRCCSIGGADIPTELLSTRECNRDMIRCLSNCNAVSAGCTQGTLIIPPAMILAAMGLVENWCCGMPCPSLSIEDASQVAGTLPDIQEDKESATTPSDDVAMNTVVSTPKPTLASAPKMYSVHCDSAHKASLRCAPPAFPHLMSKRGCSWTFMEPCLECCTRTRLSTGPMHTLG